MNTIKFTSDGKKVAIIGKLNAQETIVQEIFIVGDAEIPSGENFVVKSLHDAPSISWKDQEIKRVKEYNERLIKTLNDENKRYDEAISRATQRLKEETKKLSDKFKFIASAVKNADENSFNALLNFLEGKIKFLVKNDGYPDILIFSQEAEKYSDNDYWSGINLISLFGKDDGTLQFRIFDYYDGYKSYINVIPFETEQEAILKLHEVIDNIKEYNEHIISVAKKYEIKLNEVKFNDYKTKTSQNIIKNIDNNKKNIEMYESQLEKINRLS